LARAHRQYLPVSNGAQLSHETLIGVIEPGRGDRRPGAECVHYLLSGPLEVGEGDNQLRRRRVAGYEPRVRSVCAIDRRGSPLGRHIDRRLVDGHPLRHERRLVRTEPDLTARHDGGLDGLVGRVKRFGL
jgi:hypothetical protein